MLLSDAYFIGKSSDAYRCQNLKRAQSQQSHVRWYTWTSERPVKVLMIKSTIRAYHQLWGFSIHLQRRWHLTHYILLALYHVTNALQNRKWNSQYVLCLQSRMSNYRIILFVVIAATILCHSHTYAGPARSLASVVAARSIQSKIPRSIRTPFRNTEMMTARGFGKRSQQYNELKEGKYFYISYS